MTTGHDTLHGGREIHVTFFPEAPGTEPTKGTVLVRQFRIGEYRALFAMSDDEINLCAAAISPGMAHAPMESTSFNQAAGKLNAMTPESYEAVYTAMREVNEKGFFIYRERQVQRAAENLKGMPADLVERFANAARPLPPGPTPLPTRPQPRT